MKWAVMAGTVAAVAAVLWVATAAHARQAALSIAAPGTPANAVRVIADPATGDRWLLERDPSQPGGPGRLVLSAGDRDRATTQEEKPQAARRRAAPRVIHAALQPVIRAGDRVVVEEHTAVMDAALEGIALSAARTGAGLRVRLKIGGRVVAAVALAAGRVAMVPAGARP